MFKYFRHGRNGDAAFGGRTGPNASEMAVLAEKWQARWCICQHLLRFACLEGVAAVHCDAAAADERKLVECHGTCERKGWRT